MCTLSESICNFGWWMWLRLGKMETEFFLDLEMSELFCTFFVQKNVRSEFLQKKKILSFFGLRKKWYLHTIKIAMFLWYIPDHSKIDKNHMWVNQMTLPRRTKICSVRKTNISNQHTAGHFQLKFCKIMVFSGPHKIQFWLST